MPAIPAIFAHPALGVTLNELVKRINTTITASSPQAAKIAHKTDPWLKAGKYSLGWVHFSIILLIATSLIHLYHMWTDKMRRALYKEEVVQSAKTTSPDSDFEMANLHTNNSAVKFFPRTGLLPEPPREESSISSITPINNAIALLRWVFYRPLPVLRHKKKTLALPSAGAAFIILVALVFTVLYCVVPQPLFYVSIAFGSPPVAIRAGMIAVAMMPWIIALSMKANLITVLTGIGHERLNVLHRWGGYLCLLLSLIHTIPFYVQPPSDPNGLAVFKSYFNQQFYIYGTGIAALAPLAFLCIHSMPFLRTWMYELFVALHVPASIIFLAMMFWHCHNYLTSWNYLFATVAIWFLSYCVRIFYLNWFNPWRPSWLIGEEAAITLLPENAVKVTIPTQCKWRPGQYVYLRMPGISIFENHPFTIASLCSNDFPSEYGEQYRDMTLVFRPFGGFTRKVVNAAVENGPYHTYRAFIDGPYGGMQRELASFDTVILFAGGSGITAIVSQLLDLIKLMRDGRAVTKQVNVVWAIKRPETMEWFKEELRICRQYAPPDSVHCQFFITAAKRTDPNINPLMQPDTPHSLRHARPTSLHLHERINDAFQGVADKRNSALIREAAAGDPEKEHEYRKETEDEIVALPQAHLSPVITRSNPPPPVLKFSKPHSPTSPIASPTFPPPPTKPISPRAKPKFKLQIPTPQQSLKTQQQQNFDFGFPSTPTLFQKNLMRFAFLPSVATKRTGWRTEYGRPDIPYMLKGFQREFGKRTCVFVCGPPSMRVDVQNCVARMQSHVLSSGGTREEIFLHTENYAI